MPGLSAIACNFTDGSGCQDVDGHSCHRRADEVAVWSGLDAPNNGTVTVTCDGHMDRPAACPIQVYSIELVAKGTVIDSSKGVKTYPANGSNHGESWRGLPAGQYYLNIWIDNSNPNCHLIGTINVAAG